MTKVIHIIFLLKQFIVKLICQKPPERYEI